MQTVTVDHDWCSTFAHAATWLGGGPVVVVLTAAASLWCLFGRRWVLAGWLVATVAGSALLNSLLKAGLDKARPSSAGLLTTAHGFAFPSGHTQAATTQRYSHLLDDPLRAATEKVGAIVTGAGRRQ